MIRFQTCGAPDEISEARGFVPLNEEEELAQTLLRPCFGSDTEDILIAGFDAFDRLLCLEQIQATATDHCVLPPQSWRNILSLRPVRVLLAHNHPSGVAKPSDADTAMTREVTRFLAHTDILLEDHLIFTNAGHFSFWRAELL